MSPSANTAKKNLLLMQANTHLVIASSYMHLEGPLALLKTPLAKIVVARATGDPDARVVEPPNNKRQNLLGNPGCAATSDDAGEKRQM